MLAFQPAQTQYTGIDPGEGFYYTYHPSVVQTDRSTRYVYYCGNSASDVVRDHIFASVGRLAAGQWRFGHPVEVFGPEDGPADGYFRIHTCEPSVLGGHFTYGGRPFRWVMLFTAESSGESSTNQIGAAFANAPLGPWQADAQPLIVTSDDFGVNQFPSDCPVDKGTGKPLYCLGEPAMTSIGGNRILLTYMGNSGSPGTNAAPAEGLVLRVLNLSNVPATGDCTSCIVTLPDGQKEEAVPLKGLHSGIDDASIGYDPVYQRVAMSWDSGGYDTTPDGAPVNEEVYVMTIGLAGLLNGSGTWTTQGIIGRCLSGHLYNHNSGIVRNAVGDLPSPSQLGVFYSVANDNVGGNWGVYDYRIFETSAPLTSSPVAAIPMAEANNSCLGFDAVDAAGHVASVGSATNDGSSANSSPSDPVVGIATTPNAGGYYLVHRNGQIETFGDARSQGSPTDAADVVGMAVDPATGGYWVAEADGTVSAVNAPSLGSIRPTAHLGQVVGIAPIANGVGYYLVTSIGAVYAFGHARYFGGITAPGGPPIVGMAPTPDGLGYYLLTANGAVLTYGDAPMLPPTGPVGGSPVVGIAATADGQGYWVDTAGGGVEGFGDAPSEHLADPAGSPLVGISVT